MIISKTHRYERRKGAGNKAGAKERGLFLQARNEPYAVVVRKAGVAYAIGTDGAPMPSSHLAEKIPEVFSCRPQKKDAHVMVGIFSPRTPGKGGFPVP
ncbi:MAG: hypothetical protein ACRD1X_14305 [Vicinamibacteria bacterium]